MVVLVAFYASALPVGETGNNFGNLVRGLPEGPAGDQLASKKDFELVT